MPYAESILGIALQQAFVPAARSVSGLRVALTHVLWHAAARMRRILAFASIVAAVAGLGTLWIGCSSEGPEPPRTLGAPLRAAGAVFLLTAEFERRDPAEGSRWTPFRGVEKVMHVDVSRFDEKSAEPAWRRRLLTEREGSTADLGLLGADDDRLWVFVREPLVLSLATGEVLAGAKAIEARNPALKGAVPRRMGRYRFYDGYGLVLTAADGREWLVDVQTLASVPWQGPGPIARESAIGVTAADAKDGVSRP